MAAQPRSFADRNAEIAARAVAGELYGDLAREYGVSGSRIGQIVDRVQAAELAEAEADLEAAALRERARFAIELAATVDVDERYELLSFVVWPTPELAEASAFSVLDRLTAPRHAGRRGSGSCTGCGIAFAGDRYTAGCQNCVWRASAVRQREREREARVTPSTSPRVT